MCKFFSAIMLKQNILWDNKEMSHTLILEKNGIDDTVYNPKFVRIEYVPKSFDENLIDSKNWEFIVDQDFKPDWFDFYEQKKRFEDFFWKEVFDKIILFNKDIEELKGDGHIWIIINSTVNHMCGNSTVNRMCDNSTVNHMCDNSTVKYVLGNSTVNHMCGNSTVEYMLDNSTVNHMCDNSTVKYVLGNSTVNHMCGNSTVNRMCDNSTVENSII